MSNQPSKNLPVVPAPRLETVFGNLARPWRNGKAAGYLRVARGIPVVPALILTTFVLCALFSPFIAPHDPLYFDPGETLRPPAWCQGGSAKHLLGTDGVGRDILSRIIYGSRVSITVASYVIGLSATFGIFLGLIAGYFRGLVDTFLMRVADVMQAMPGLLFILALAAILPRGLKTVVIVLCVFGWAGYTRIIRGVVLSLREKDFIALARVAQASPLRIMFRHILPNLVNIITVLVTLEVGGLILAEAGLSFIGVGIPSPTPSWGGMLSEGRKFISTAWWLATFPGLAIMAVVFSCNYIGDWVRDRLDPTLRQY